MAPCYSLCNLQHYTKRRMLVEAVSALCPACVLDVIHDRFSHYQSYICIYLCRNDIHASRAINEVIIAFGSYLVLHNLLTSSSPSIQ